jgi:hypothetical protein
LDLSDSIRVRIPKIWNFLQLASLNQIFYDSDNPDLKLNCIFRML